MKGSRTVYVLGPNQQIYSVDEMSGDIRGRYALSSLKHVVTNPMLNGEVIRLDGALRMPPR